MFNLLFHHWTLGLEENKNVLDVNKEIRTIKKKEYVNLEIRTIKKKEYVNLEIRTINY